MSDITLDHLQIEIDASARNASTAIDKLDAQLEKLQNALGKITQGQAFANFEKVCNSLRSISGATIPTDTINGISGLASAVSKFGNASVSKGVANMPIVSQQLQNMTASLNGFSLGEDAMAISSLANSMARLGNTNVSGANIPSLTNAVKNMVTELNGVTVSESANSIIRLSNAISKLGGKQTTNAIVNIPKLTKELHKMITELSNAPQVSNNTVRLAEALGKLNGKTKNINNFTQMSNGMNKLSLSSRNLSSGFGSLASKIGLFYANFFVLIRGFKSLFNSIKSAMDYIETYNYFDAAFEQVTNSAEKNWEQAGYDSYEAYKEGFEKGAKELNTKMSGFLLGEDGSLTSSGGTMLGIDPNMLLGYQAQFSQMTSSMGVASEYAVKLSNAMSMLGADLASVKNMDFADVYDDMSSGLTGMSRSLDKYGTNIRNANMQEKLLELGIQANIRNINQNDKALLRSIIMLDSTRYAWGDLSDTLNQPANQLRMLQSGFSNLSRTIGSAFLGVLSSTLPYLNAFVIALQRLAEWIIKLFGVELPSITSSATGNMSDFLDDMDDSLESATGNAKKLKQQLLGIDELNVISTKDNSSSGVGSGTSDTAAIQSAFDKIYDEYTKKWEEAYKNVENKAQKMADKFNGILQPIKDIFQAIKDGDWEGVGEGITSFITNPIGMISDAIKNMDWEKLGKNIGDFIAGIDEVKILSSIEELASRIFDAFIRTWKASFKENPLGTIIASGIGIAALIMKFSRLGNQLALAFVTAFAGFEIGKKIGEVLTKEQSKIFGTEDDSFWYETFRLDDFFETVTEDFKTTFDSIINLLTDFKNNPIFALVGTAMVAGLFMPFTAIPTLIAIWIYKIKDQIANFFVSIGTDIKLGVDSAISEIKWGYDYFMKLFDITVWEGWLDGIEDLFKKITKNIAKVVISTINKVIDKINEAMEIKWDDVKVAGKVVVEGGSATIMNIPKIKGYATGGMPSSGEIFISRENGMPEMVGQFGNNTAVANNEQIVEGIQGGVERAVSSILLPYLQQIANDTSECASKDYETSTDGLLRKVRNGARTFKKTTGNDAFAF